MVSYYNTKGSNMFLSSANVRKKKLICFRNKLLVVTAAYIDISQDKMFR